jgi:plastocyanin
MRGRPIRLAIALVAVCGFGLAAAYALGATGEISSATTCASINSCSYSASSFTITGGQVAKFHNATISSGYSGTSHSVLANNRKTLGGKPLFVSKIIPSGATTAVNGTQYLAPGDYVFHCAIHGPSMSATLHVAGGAPLARPKVALKVTSGTLAAVRKSGKLAIKVTGSGSKASGVDVKAMRNGKKLAEKRGVSVAAGSSKPVKLGLSSVARKSLKGLDKATIKLAAKVPFGKAVAATRTLH